MCVQMHNGHSWLFLSSLLQVRPDPKPPRKHETRSMGFCMRGFRTRRIDYVRKRVLSEPNQKYPNLRCKALIARLQRSFSRLKTLLRSVLHPLEPWHRNCTTDACTQTSHDMPTIPSSFCACSSTEQCKLKPQFRISAAA